MSALMWNLCQLALAALVMLNLFLVAVSRHDRRPATRTVPAARTRIRQ